MSLPKLAIFLPILIMNVLGDNGTLTLNNTHSDDFITADTNTSHSDLLTSFTQSVTIYQRLPPPSNSTIPVTASNHSLNSSLPTKILIHDVSESISEDWVDQTVYNYHTKGDYNVLVVDWSEVITFEDYYEVRAIDEVGRVVGNFIVDVVTQGVIATEDVHLIGKGAGGHVGGAAGRTVANKTDKVGRITGLDPEETDGLNKEDAEFVDVIHTSHVIGDHSLGTVDFYVYDNDTKTPLCYNGTCGVGGMADEIYADSILDATRYKGVSCHDVNEFVERLCNEAEKTYIGEGVNRNASGYYTVTTSGAGILGNGMFLTVIGTIVAYYLLNC